MPGVGGTDLSPGAHNLERRLLDAHRVGGDHPVRQYVGPLPLALQGLDSPQRVVGPEHRADHRLRALPFCDARQPCVDGLRPRF